MQLFKLTNILSQINILTLLAEYVRGGKGGGTSEEISAGCCFPAIFIDYKLCHIRTCVVIHTYIHACIHMYVHTYIHIHTYIHTYTHTYGTAQVQRRTRSKNFVELGYSLDGETSECRGQSQLHAQIAASTRLGEYSIIRVLDFNNCDDSSLTDSVLIWNQDMGYSAVAISNSGAFLFHEFD